KLNDEEIKSIIDIMLKQVQNRLKEQKISIDITSEVKDLIASKGIDKSFGARPLRRTIQNLVEDTLAEAILDGEIEQNKLATLKVEDEKVVVK
ncbi:MAG: hypothetical protein HFJ17_03620, partial [Clostridia bacterium]|nr:hypothetical protein [Clostridia bacterium]